MCIHVNKVICQNAHGIAAASTQYVALARACCVLLHVVMNEGAFK